MVLREQRPLLKAGQLAAALLVIVMIHSAPQFLGCSLDPSVYRKMVSGSNVERQGMYIQGLSSISGTVVHVEESVTLGEGDVRSSNFISVEMIL